MSYPHTAIGQLQYIEGVNGGKYLCTGTLFTDRHVLTCAHCIYDKEHNEYNRDWHFVPGLHGKEKPFGSIAYAAACVLSRLVTVTQPGTALLRIT